MGTAHPPRDAGWRSRLRGTKTVPVLAACLAGLPLVTLFASLADWETAIWQHLARYVLPGVILETLPLVVFVALGTLALGTGLALLTTCCEFPGRRFFEWALVLPLAIPSYVLAFIAVANLDYAGSIAVAVRAALGIESWPQVRSWPGAAVVLTGALYPYVYLAARAGLMSQGRRAMEVALTLGCSPAGALWRAALPMCRPWLVAGVGLVVMETLAEFGAVAILNVNTFTFAIYRAWQGMFSIEAAFQLAGLLALAVLAGLAIERRAGGSRRYHSTSPLATRRVALIGGRGYAATAAALLVWSLAFALPVLQLAGWSVANAATELDARYAGYVLRSAALGLLAAVVVVALALWLAYAHRADRSAWIARANDLATLGYAVPGPVLALGLLVPLAAASTALNFLWLHVTGNVSPWLLHSSLTALLLAYVIRFLAVAYRPVESGLRRLSQSLDDSALLLGVAGTALVRRIHVPLLYGSLSTAAVLVFVDVLKEMPMTLMMRPFGWDTLATRIFELTSEGEWQRAALPALALVLAGLAPVAFLVRSGRDAR